MRNEDASLIELDATAAVAAMSRGEVSAERYANALLAQAHRLESLNAFRTLDAQQVLEAARAHDIARAGGRPCGALHGLPIPVKDSVDTASLPTSNGTRALRDFRPLDDAAVLKPLLAHGAIVMGKTNLHELSRGYTSNNGAFGAVRNPHNVDHVPGGSSGGSGAAVAARIAPLAVAEDTLGSIRVPASMCGIAGFRPSYGRYSGQGIMALTLDKFDQVGPLARSVADLTLFDSVVTGDFSSMATRLPGDVRLGVAPDLLGGLDSEVERVIHQALQRLREAGVSIVDVKLPASAQHALTAASIIIGYENMLSMSKYLREQATGISFEQLLDQMSPNLKIFYQTTAPPGHEVYEVALRQRDALRADMQGFFAEQRIDALAFPPILVPPPPLGDNFELEVAGERMPIRKVMGRNTALGSVASLASLVLPAGTVRGLPVGMEFAAVTGADRQLLAVGRVLEGILGRLAAPALSCER
ncbi:mandelamide amidase [Povalibacter uvarum]|uniref:Mandelamide amidase n=1 Tax=Povalibacter uvarum TaxID=732238 RepID=A0A841HIW4_9GAMM|nr:amidase family protein [Povalibacter uvarum]MBB6092957.1 mandelamide amidase [Povalibacter uvarum]